eukprot:TRINITY_DN27143_c0_g1_i1.p1 TRINITY_DN27143_c0_g1~~TRINITY_DN27143_c0_g1_i1.p1  ORF type:complete len:397 (+),score=44.34 TRINITY_DN27143_c0_g1_i1:68-1258(+)
MVPPLSARAMTATASSRAAEKHQQKVFSLPPRPEAEVAMAPAGKSTGMHAPRSSKPPAPGDCLAAASIPEMRDEEVVRITQHALYTGEQRPHGAADYPTSHASGGMPPYPFHDVSPLDEEAARALQRFTARVRKSGPSGILRLDSAFKVAAEAARRGAGTPRAGGGMTAVLDFETFVAISLREGLLYSRRECEVVFGCLSRGCRTLPAGAIARLGRDRLSAQRVDVVREVWSRLDTTGAGVAACDLVKAFDARRLTSVRFGAMSKERALTEFLEGLGILVQGAPREFELEEVASGRRPALAGTPGQPIVAPAGQPTAQRASWRPRGDVARELASQPKSIVDSTRRITYPDFEAYYEAISVSIHDDEDFRREVGAEVARRLEKQGVVGIRSVRLRPL